jgi:hypothetical protein
LSGAENTKQRIWKPRVRAEFERPHQIPRLHRTRRQVNERFDPVLGIGLLSIQTNPPPTVAGPSPAYCFSRNRSADRFALRKFVAALREFVNVQGVFFGANMHRFRKWLTVPSRTTGQKALWILLSEDRIQRIGKGTKGDPFRYFEKQAKKKKRKGPDDKFRVADYSPTVLATPLN